MNEKRIQSSTAVGLVSDKTYWVTRCDVTPAGKRRGAWLLCDSLVCDAIALGAGCYKVVIGGVTGQGIVNNLRYYLRGTPQPVTVEQQGSEVYLRVV